MYADTFVYVRQGLPRPTLSLLMPQPLPYKTNLTSRCFLLVERKKEGAGWIYLFFFYPHRNTLACRHCESEHPYYLYITLFESWSCPRQARQSNGVSLCRGRAISSLTQLWKTRLLLHFSHCHERFTVLQATDHTLRRSLSDSLPLTAFSLSLLLLFTCLSPTLVIIFTPSVN